MKKTNLTTLALLLTLAIPSSAFAVSVSGPSDDNQKDSGDVIRACQEKKDKSLSKDERTRAKYSCRASQAARVLHKAVWGNGALDKKLPRKMVDAADCVIVLPKVTSIGLIFAGVSWGQGVFSCKDDSDKWSSPRFISVKNGKWMFGFEFTRSDYVMIIKADDAETKLTSGKIELGAEGAAVLGPWGRKGRLSTNLKAAIYTYSKSKGVALGAGFTVGGIKLNKDANNEVGSAKVSEGIRAFADAVEAETK